MDSEVQRNILLLNFCLFTADIDQVLSIPELLRKLRGLSRLCDSEKYLVAS